MSQDQLNYLESERLKLWAKTTELQLQLDSVKAETPAEALTASKKAAEYRNRAKEYFEEITQLRAQISEQAQSISQNHTITQDLTKSIELSTEEAASRVNQILKSHESARSNQEKLDGLIEIITTNAEWLEQKQIEISSIEEHLKKLGESKKKSDLLLQNSSEIANDLQELHSEIFGFEETDENGKATKIEGLKAKLEKSYVELAQKLSSASTEIQSVIKKSSVDAMALSFEWERELKDIKEKIEKLLPAALTAGLSSAYSTKKTEEIEEGQKLLRIFYLAIAGLVGVSTIPFAVSIHSLINNVTLQDTLIRIPRLVLAIAPLYIPILWVAYSANRRANLSKRLVEEYSHKEVQAKTYEGLSRQINTIDGPDSNELRIKLLYNILEISAENPGKLISDYNKADHPLMDALDKSIKLTNAVDKLSRIPGFAKVTAQMQQRAERILSENEAKAAAGLAALDNDNEKK
jgi:hypothetical protein